MMLGLLIEGTVAGLLMLTIGYCAVLNKRLTRLKADEMSLKATISELITAAEIAERAIAGLKVTVHECEETLGVRMSGAERVSAELDRRLKAGDDILSRLSQIAMATRTAAPPLPDSRATLAAANAFAERARTRSSGLAA
jgi:hypothetical protein